MCNSTVMKNISSTSMASETPTEGETDGDTRTAVTIWDQELWMSPYCQIPWTAMTTIMCVHMRVCVCMCVCDVGVRKVVACVCVCARAQTFMLTSLGVFVLSAAVGGILFVFVFSLSGEGVSTAVCGLGERV